jgi:hypothetical protein
MDPLSPVKTRPPPRPLGSSQQPNLPIPSSTPITSRQNLDENKVATPSTHHLHPHDDTRRDSGSKTRNEGLTRNRDSGTIIVSEQAEGELEREETQLLDVTDQSFEDEVEIGDLSLNAASDVENREWSFIRRERCGRFMMGPFSTCAAETSLDELPFHV